MVKPKIGAVNRLERERSVMGGSGAANIQVQKCTTPEACPLDCRQFLRTDLPGAKAYFTFDERWVGREIFSTVSPVVRFDDFKAISAWATTPHRLPISSTTGMRRTMFV